MQRSSGQFHVFAITRKLQMVSGIPNHAGLIRGRIGSEYYDYIDEGEANSNELGHVEGDDNFYPVDIEVIAAGFDETEALKFEQDYQARLEGMEPDEPSKIIEL